MKTLVKNAILIPMTERNFSFRGSLGVSDGKIAFLAPEGAVLPSDFKADEVIDASGMAVLPSFVNAHTHLAMTLMRNYKDTCANLEDWLSEIFPIEDKLTPSDVESAYLLGCAELIKNGCTCYADMYFFQAKDALAAIKSGIKANIGLTLFGDLSETKRRFGELLPELEAAVSDAPSGSLSVDIAPHAIYTTSAESYQYAADYAYKHPGVRLHTHCAETKTEVATSLSRFGKTPLDYLESIGFFDKAPVYLAHCVHLTPSEIKKAAALKLSIVHNPASNMKLASGIAPVSAFRRAGINLALGTDGASSNNSLNMMKDINLAALLATVGSSDTLALPPYEALEAATLGGARALGRESQIGTLEPGKDADFIAVDLSTVSTTPLNDLFSALVYSATSENIRYVFSSGRMLLKDRKVLTVDEQALIFEVNSVWSSILSR